VDLWTEVAKFLDGKSLVKLAATCRWFHSVIMHDSVWKFACLRDLQVPAPCQVAFKWIKLYGSLAGNYQTPSLLSIFYLVRIIEQCDNI